MKEQLVETPTRMYGERSDYAEKVLSEVLGQKYIDYRKKWVKVAKGELETDFPLYIQIEHTGKCNLRCPYCTQGIPALRKEYSNGFKPLGMDLYKKILAEAKEHNCPSMSFHNTDEPLLLKDLEERIRMARDAGFLDLIITTNATLLNEARAEKLIVSGITKINFSLDAYNEEDYKKVRIGGDFGTVLKNILYFMEVRDFLGIKIPVTRATCVLSKYTAHKTHLFEAFWLQIVDMVEFQNYQEINGITKHLKPPKSEVDTGFTCNSPSQQIVIRANGDVLPCCSFYGTELVIGNVNNSSIYNIWNSEKMNKLRRALAVNKFDENSACSKCSKSFYK